MSAAIAGQDTETASFEALRRADVSVVRAAIRSGRYQGHTAGLGPGRLQCNLVILPQTQAIDFFRFCQRNPKPCPLVGVSDTGDPMMRTLGADIDIRTDVPRYIVYRYGERVEERESLHDLWRDDLIAFALGCSFTFEQALIRAGIAMRHIDEDRTVPMYRTRLETVPAGPFGGGMVVSMRPVADGDIERAVTISGRYPQAHGAPVHIGSPDAIGIDDLGAPDWGDPAPIGAGETPVFWACGVTPQNAVLRARPPICITHKPGRMLITDIPDDAESPVLPTTIRTDDRREA